MKLSGHLLVVCLALIFVVAHVSCDNGQGSTENAAEQPKSARARFQMPKLFDFARFKEIFKKSYGSILEELARKKIMLANAFTVFISMIRYKYKKVSHWLKVNHLSDRTPEELERRMMKSKDHEFVPDMRDDDDLLHAASEEDIEQVMETLEKHKMEPGYNKIISELAAGVDSSQSRRRRKRSVAKTRDISVSDLIADPKLPVGREISSPVPSNNPNYQPIDLPSNGAGDDDSMQDTPMSDGWISKIKSFPGVTYLSSLVNNALTEVTEGEEDVEEDVEGEYEGEGEGEVKVKVEGEGEGESDDMDIDDDMDVDEEVEKLEDVVYIDHRESNCFYLPRDQADCGSCYAFATISLYEWDFCRQVGKKVAFSEQFLVDCGPMVGLSDGCDGAPLENPFKFVNMFGLELRRNYPYRGHADECPYDPDYPSNQVGYIRHKEKSFAIIKPEEFNEFLPKSPILVGFWLPSDFSYYGGGVDEAFDCGGEDGHAMLLIGAGIEDGKAYYLIRNSYSHVWGEQGYYKMSVEGFYRCLKEKRGIISRGAHEEKKLNVLNANYNQDPVAKRSHTYLTGEEGTVAAPAAPADAA